jgi:hypothetical protein
LDLRYGSGGATLSIVASSAGGQISGTVHVAGNARAKTIVGLLLDDGYPSQHSDCVGSSGGSSVGSPFPRAVWVDEDGVYSFRSIPPGKYKLVVVKGDDCSAEEELYLYSGEAESVEVHAGDKLTKDLNLPASSH